MELGKPWVADLVVTDMRERFSTTSLLSDESVLCVASDCRIHANSVSL